MRTADEREFNNLVGKIDSAAQMLRQDALGVINRSVTARAWLTGYYIVEYEQGGKSRAEYGDGLLKKLAKRLPDKSATFESLKKNRRFYQTFPDLSVPIAAYIRERFGNGDSLIPRLSLSGQVGSVQPPQKIWESPIPQLGEGFLIENGDGSVKISPWALFNRTSYTHMLQLLPLHEDLMRTFYAFEAIRGTWSVKELKRQIESQYYQRCGWSKDPHKYAAMVQGKAEKLNADDFIKASNVLEHVGTGPVSRGDRPREAGRNLKKILRQS